MAKPILMFPEGTVIEAAFFDVDHTITKHATGIKYLTMFLKRNRLPLSFLFAVPRIFFRYKSGKLKAHNYSDVLDEMVGIPKELLDSVAEKCFEKKLKKDIYPQIKEIIDEYNKKNIPVVLATSSPRFIIEPLAKFFKADHLIATDIEFEKGLTNGRFKGEPSFREHKRFLVEQWINGKKLNPENCIFYSDSIHDLPTLEYIGQPVTVNPDVQLKVIAEKRKWTVLTPRLKKKYS